MTIAAKGGGFQPPMTYFGRAEAHQPRGGLCMSQVQAQTQPQDQDVFSKVMSRLDEIDKTLDLLVDGVQKMLEKLIELQGQLRLLVPQGHAQQQSQQPQHPQTQQSQQQQANQVQPDRDLSPEDVDRIVMQLRRGGFRGGYKRYGGYYRGRRGYRRWWR